jgi:hypothetical protein
MRERFLDHILVVAANVATHRAYIARLPRVANPAPYPERPSGVPQVDWHGRSIIEYFNVNLVSLFALPCESSEYVAYAALGRYVSNTVRIRLVET